jgi:hypothetical protein
MSAKYVARNWCIERSAQNRNKSVGKVCGSRWCIERSAQNRNNQYRKDRSKNYRKNRSTDLFFRFSFSDQNQAGFSISGQILKLE